MHDCFCKKGERESAIGNEQKPQQQQICPALPTPMPQPRENFVDTIDMGPGSGISTLTEPSHRLCCAPRGHHIHHNQQRLRPRPPTRKISQKARAVQLSLLSCCSRHRWQPCACLSPISRARSATLERPPSRAVLLTTRHFETMQRRRTRD